MQLEVDPALHNMVEQQIRPWDVLNQQVLDAILSIPRVHFVPNEYGGLAYADTEIPIGHSETMMAPKIEARMIQALDLKPEDTVLEVGTGSGYVTALLAKLCRHVYSVDIHPDFVEQAEKKLHALDIHNVTLEVGDAVNGWQHHAPYNAIAITGALPLGGKSFQSELKVGGRMFVVTGEPPAMSACLIKRVEREHFAEEVLFETVLKNLVHAPLPQKFVF